MKVKCYSIVVLGIFVAASLLLLGFSNNKKSQQTTNNVITTDFSEYDTGTDIPEGWKELWATSDYEIAKSPSRLIKTSNGDPRHLLAWEDVGVVDGDVEVATLLRVP